MPIGDPIYTDEQRDAVAFAYRKDGRGLAMTADRVIELAAEGALKGRGGVELGPFKVTEGSVRSIASRARRRAAGKLPSTLPGLPPRDATENLRQRLVALSDRELEHLERMKPGTVDPERGRQVTRWVHEVSRLPGPNDPRPPGPDSGKRDGTRGVQRPGGAAGELLKAHRAGTLEPASGRAAPQEARSGGELPAR